MSQPLEYQPRHVNRPRKRTEFDDAYERERGVWLRRRFLWFLGISIFLSLPSLIPGCGSPGGSDFEMDVVFLDVSVIILLLIYVAAFVWSIANRPRYDRILRVAMLVYIVGGAWFLLFSRGYFRPVVDAAVSLGITKAAEASARQVLSTPPNFLNADVASTVDPDVTTPAEEPPDVQAGDVVELPGIEINTSGVDSPTRGLIISNARLMNASYSWQVDLGITVFVWAFIAGFLAFNHLITCFIVPWTVRESIKPALLLLLGVGLIIAFDVLMTHAGAGKIIALSVGVGLLVATLLGFLPGTLLCWWRFSRFNRNFRLQFESSRYRAIQHELEGARLIHEAALPKPVLDGPVRVEFVYEPMRQIGGDLLVVRKPDPLRPGLVDVIVLDVTGHGVAAALTVNRLVGEIERTYAERQDISPESAVRALNRYVYLTLSHHAVFVTALAMRIDASENTIRYVNAGHPPGFVISADGTTTRRLEPTSMLLGASDDDCFDPAPQTMQLVPGEAVIAYTDGASEAFDDANRMLMVAGVERLVVTQAKEYRDPRVWPRAILDGVIRHRAGTPQDDTLVVAAWIV
jgi:serine phosphatase RsbU (regulator of sigma subunit)